MEKLVLADGCYLSSVAHTDKDALVEHMKAPEIAENTLVIPYPYTEKDAEEWINGRIAHRKKQGCEVTFAIREPGGMLIGAVGAGNFEVGSSHRASIGYWLAKPYWGKGITTMALERYVDYAFPEFGVVKLVAEVYPWNPASARVLEKVGFTREGYLRSHIKKGERLIDAIVYGLVRGDRARVSEVYRMRQCRRSR